MDKFRIYSSKSKELKYIYIAQPYSTYYPEITGILGIRNNSIDRMFHGHPQTSDIRRTLVDKNIVDHSDVVGA